MEALNSQENNPPNILTHEPKEKVLKVLEMVLYRNNRCNVVFSDGSAIILHPKGDCFTYFYENGEKARHFIAFPPVKDRIKDKLVSSVDFYNKYCSNPIVLLEEAFEGKISQKSSEIKKFYWKYDSNTQPVKHKSGTYSYSSINGYCKLKLNPNKFIFCAEFLQKLPNKSLDWVSNGTSDKRKLKQVCKYALVKQYFSVNKVPEHFLFPAKVLYPELKGFELEISEDLQTGVLGNESKFYKQLTVDEFSTKIPEVAGMNIATYLAEKTSRYSQSYSKTSIDTKSVGGPPEKDSRLKEAGVWESDDVSPSCSSFSYKKSNISLIWTKGATYRRTEVDKVEIFIHGDKTILIARDYGNFFDHYQVNTPEGKLRTFPITAIPLYSVSESQKYTFKTLVEKSLEMFRNTADDMKEEAKSEDSLQDIWIKSITSITDKDIVDTQEVPGCGRFFAYRVKQEGLGEFNESIEIKFEDRTHLRMIKGFPLIKINTFFGTELKLNLDEKLEFTKFLTKEEKESIPYYIKTGLEYMEWAFLSLEERYKREKEEITHQNRLESLCGSNNTLY
ncbi:unnamed protein product [Moneuplotes crassus]|uniref:Uncharacterized protein n=1 Tax=Euplotes crassus TaxID=5936 RepID=A0AAD1U990_EUPCR|nr:unnamed protein product [Moneuplotes crassus]